MHLKEKYAKKLKINEMKKFSLEFITSIE